ncbi:MAG: hypothetical protein ACM3MF_06110 [Anaerolineae bacterium]
MQMGAVLWRTTWRSVLVAISYAFGLMVAGIIGGVLGWQMTAKPGSEQGLVPVFASIVLLGFFLGPLAGRLGLSRIQHLVLWGSLIVFNLGSVALEGAYFAPDLVSLPVPVLLAQQLLATLAAGLAITLLFGRLGSSVSWKAALQTRPWHSWLWRFLISALSYLAFYFVFGGLNYSLVTKPYYETHAGGLTVPAPEIVLLLEAIRGVLIAFSVLLLLLSMRGSRRKLMITTGWLLFAVGGIIPLVWQINMLPLFLLFASAIEIFFQNFLTGVVAAWLMGIPGPGES